MDEREWQSAQPAGLEAFGLNRRQIAGGGLAALTFALLGCEVSAAKPSAALPARDWIEKQGELARALKSGQITPLVWMSEVERLASEIEIAQLFDEIDNAQVTANALPSTNDPRKHSVKFLDETGAPRKLGYGSALFKFDPQNVITPHGHKHMVSSHLVVEGSFRIRNYDRLRDDGEAMIIAPTRDYIARVGDLSAMSSARDNIHWFVPHDGPATTFDVIISGVDPGMPDYAMEAVDPLGGELLDDGSIRAPKIGFEEASAKYTAAV